MPDLTWSLNVDNYDSALEGDPPAPGDRWCSLWGPRGPCHPSIEGTADEWLAIAAAIEKREPLAFKRVSFAPVGATQGFLHSPRNGGEHTLTAAELDGLVRSIRDQLDADAIVRVLLPGFLPHLRAAIDRAIAPREVKQIAEDAVGDFIRGHARRISEQHDGCTDAETVADFAAEVHDILNNLRADEHAEVYDGRPGRRVAAGPTEPPAPREVTAAALAKALTLTWPKTYVGRGALADIEANDLLHHLGRVAMPTVDTEALKWASSVVGHNITSRMLIPSGDMNARAIAAIDAVIAAQEVTRG